MLATLFLSVPCSAQYTVLWQDSDAACYFCVPNFNGPVCPSPHPIADYDSDGQNEIVSVGTDNGITTLRVLDMMTGQSEFQTTLAAGNWAGSLADAIHVDGDSAPEIVIFNQSGGIAVIKYIGTTSIHDPASPARVTSEATIRPNPFNPSATIDYTLPAQGKANIQIYDVAGRSVRTLVDGAAEPGQQSVVWDGRSADGHQLPSGTYFYSLSLDGHVLDKGKAVILK